MSNFQNVLVANGAAVLLLFILLLSSNRTLHHTLFDDRVFLLMVWANIMQCLVETLTFYVDGRTGVGFRELAIILNTFLYINNIFFAYLWTVYADFKLFEDMKRIKHIYSFMAIPAVLISVGSIVNLFYPLFFRISADNIYQRESLYILPYGFTYAYLAYGVILIYANRKKVNKYLFMPAILFMIPILIGSLLQFLFYGFSLVWLGVAIALVSLYVNVQNEVSYTDVLSGLFTRQYMIRYLTSETKKVNSNKILAGIMIDIDHFKSINDIYGHLTGDDAIRSFGAILRRAVPAEAVAVRFAGDEFMVLMLVDQEAAVSDTAGRIQSQTSQFNAEGKKPYTLQFSVGYSIYDRKNDTIDRFLGRIDAAMYAEKKQKQKQKQAEKQ